MSKRPPEPVLTSMTHCELIRCSVRCECASQQDFAFCLPKVPGCASNTSTRLLCTPLLMGLKASSGPCHAS